MILCMCILKLMMSNLLNHITAQGYPYQNVSDYTHARGSQLHFGKISESLRQTQNFGKFSKISPTPAHLMHLKAPTAQLTYTAATTDMPSQPVHTTCTSTVMDAHCLDFCLLLLCHHTLVSLL